MKKRIQKVFVFLLTMILVLPLLFPGIESSAAAKHKRKYYPSVSCSKKTLNGNGDTFTLSVNNVKGKVKNISWDSLDNKVAAVQNTNDPKKVTVTATGKGSTRIKCTVTYQGGLKYNVYCTVTVKTAVSRLTISNVRKDKNGRHVIAVGESYDFDTKLTPKAAKEQTYWQIDRTEYAAVSNQGIVIGLKPGIVNLTAIAAISKDKVSSSTIRDSVCIEVIDMGNKDAFYSYWDYCSQWNYWDYWKSWNWDDSWDWESWDWDYEDCIDVRFGKEKGMKPQAKPVTVKRMNQNTLTATFDRDIIVPGYAVINNEWIPGTVDAKNSKQVNYSLSAAASQLTGNQKVSFGYWSSRDVRPDDKSSEKLADIYVDFTVKTVKLTGIDYIYPRSIQLTFDGALTGDPVFQVWQDNTDLFSDAWVNGNTVIISLKSTPVLKSTVYLVPASKITDTNGNQVTMNPSYVYTSQ